MTDNTEIDDLVLVDFDDRGDAGMIARVTFNNPEKRNALGVGGKQRFINVMTELRHDETLRALVITGAGDKSLSVAAISRTCVIIRLPKGMLHRPRHTMPAMQFEPSLSQ